MLCFRFSSFLDVLVIMDNVKLLISYHSSCGIKEKFKSHQKKEKREVQRYLSIYTKKESTHSVFQLIFRLNDIYIYNPCNVTPIEKFKLLLGNLKFLVCCVFLNFFKSFTIRIEVCFILMIHLLYSSL